MPKMYQMLVDILADAKNEDNISRISQPEMAILVERSQTWVVQAIQRLYTETLVLMTAAKKYVDREAV